MREIHVKDASIFCELNGRKIDIEVRSSSQKDPFPGITIYVDGLDLLLIDLRATDAGILQDAASLEMWYKKNPLFKLKDVKSNGCI